VNSQLEIRTSSLWIPSVGAGFMGMMASKLRTVISECYQLIFTTIQARMASISPSLPASTLPVIKRRRSRVMGPLISRDARSYE
jgi:hypothetical protein